MVSNYHKVNSNFLIWFFSPKSSTYSNPLILNHCPHCSLFHAGWRSWFMFPFNVIITFSFSGNLVNPWFEAVLWKIKKLLCNFNCFLFGPSTLELNTFGPKCCDFVPAAFISQVKLMKKEEELNKITNHWKDLDRGILKLIRIISWYNFRRKIVVIATLRISSENLNYWCI